MDAGRPSRTAEAVALLRALHRAVDDQPPVLDDPVAEHLLPPAQQRLLRRLPRLDNRYLARFRSRDGLTRMRSQVVVRQRLTEDALLGSGASTYLVLGAGLDTFAWRRPDGHALTVVEVDHPATQAGKQQLVQRRLAGRPAPPGCHAAEPVWCAVDFERDALAERLPAFAGPVFVAWLGVSYYLSEAAIRATLTTLANCLPAGSQLSMDYWRADLRSSQLADRALLWGTRLGVALQREPMRSFFAPEAMAALVADCGWQVQDNLVAAAQDQRCLADRQDGLAVPDFACLLRACCPGNCIAL